MLRLTLAVATIAFASPFGSSTAAPATQVSGSPAVPAMPAPGIEGAPASIAKQQPAPAEPADGNGAAIALAGVMLKPGDYQWQADAAADGPVLIAVSIAEQKLYAYRNDVLFAVSTVSTGRRGHLTPRGTFPILEKHREHYSNRYNNAPMPFMQRLTQDGVALHAGKLPGYPASHGCVRLPLAFAERLFAVTQRGGIVVVTDAALAELVAKRAPFDARTGQPIPSPAAAASSAPQETRPPLAAPAGSWLAELISLPPA